MWIKKLSEFILFSSIFIASCAVAFCMETNILLGLPLNDFSFYCFVFGATLAQYNLHYLVKTVAVKDSERLAWSQRNKNIHVVLLIAGSVLILFSLFSFHLKHFIILIFLGGISLLYSFPFLPFGKKRRIKDFGLFKILTITFLWTLVTAWFPVNSMPFETNLFLFVFVKRFVFLFVLCLLFDVRDIEIDDKEEIKTLAVILGKKRSYLLAYFSLILFVILCIAQYLYLPQRGAFISMMISAALTLVIVEFTKKTNSDFIYLAGIDGMMLLQAILVYLFVLKL
ncbi:MAG: UbiA family prenyltransferase [Bacteroidota bacterium]|nr:UbiA family prenyltransferase [Bacteroidota bacterium]